jgi:hypothetical protein
VLAVIDQFGSILGGRQRERGGTAAQKWPRFEYPDTEAGASQGGRRGESGQSTAYDDYVGHLW